MVDLENFSVTYDTLSKDQGKYASVLCLIPVIS